MHKKIYALVFLFFLAAGACCAFHYHTDKQAGLIRLHILANSDTFYDQQLKYHIKDRIVSETAPVFGKAANIEEARQIADASKEKIKNIAMEEIREHGFDYQVEVKRGTYYFPAKTYTVRKESRIESLTLPPGRYEAVRVVIGKGSGANWWCVLYPPLCFVDLGQIVLSQANLPTASAVAKKNHPEPDGSSPASTDEREETPDINTSKPLERERQEQITTRDTNNAQHPHIEYRLRIVDIFKSLF